MVLKFLIILSIVFMFMSAIEALNSGIIPTEENSNTTPTISKQENNKEEIKFLVYQVANYLNELRVTNIPTAEPFKATIIEEKEPEIVQLDITASIPSPTPIPTSTPTPIPTMVLSAPKPIPVVNTSATYPTEYGVFDTIGYTPTEQEMMMFCTVVSSETGYCADQVQKAVAHTIINRILSPKFPNNLYEALTQRNQYNAVYDYFTGNYRAGLHPGSDGWNHTMELCYEALREYDFINGAVAYYNPHMMGYSTWFEQFTCTYEDQYGRFFVI